MNFAELLDSWINEKITRSQTDLTTRVAKLEMRVAELEHLTVNREDATVSLTEYRVNEIIQNQLCDVDWNDMIGGEIDERIESAIENNESIRDEIRNFVNEQLDSELDDLTVTVRRR